jgi:hypothetical protein
MERFAVLAGLSILVWWPSGAPAQDSITSGELPLVIQAKVVEDKVGRLRVELEGDSAYIDAVPGDDTGLAGFLWIDCEITRMIRPSPKPVLEFIVHWFPITSMRKRSLGSKVPTLGEIAMLGGWTFRPERSVEELMLVITPTIVNGEQKAELEALDGSVEVTSATLKGKLRLDKNGAPKKGKLKHRFKGVMEDGPHAGTAVKGTIKIRLGPALSK